MWYRDPQLVNDLAQYRAASNLPACPTSTCIEELNQLGQPSPLPSNDPNGTADQEWSNDVDMVSAMCPNCHIVAVETTYPNPRSMTKVLANLTVAENTAANLPDASRPPVVAVNTSIGWYLGNGTPPPRSFKAAFNHPGIAEVTGTGDSGYDVDYPSGYNTVVAVTGTTLDPCKTNKCTHGKWDEVVWGCPSGNSKATMSCSPGTGSGCSTLAPAKGWQKSIEKKYDLTGCSTRVSGDVAFVAWPGVAIYCSPPIGDLGPCKLGAAHSPWTIFWGTSVGLLP